MRLKGTGLWDPGWRMALGRSQLSGSRTLKVDMDSLGLSGPWAQESTSSAGVS